MRKSIQGILGDFLKESVRYALQGKGEGQRLHDDFCRLIVRIPERENLLDVGCLDASKSLDYARILNVKQDDVCGIEYLENYIDVAAKKIDVSSVDIEKHSFPFSDETFDMVSCNQVLEHIKNIFLPLTEMERVLKTGGYLAIGIPNLAALHNRILLLLGLQPFCSKILGPHVRSFTHNAFLNLLKINSNFRFIATAGSSLYPFPYPIVDFGARLFPGLSAYTFYVIQKIKHDPSKSKWLIDLIGTTRFNS